MERRLLGHVGRQGHFQLQGVIALGRPPVVAGDPAALEASVDRRGEAVRLQGLRGRLLQAGRAAGAVGGAQVEVGQLAVEKARAVRNDGVPVQQHGIAMARLHARQFGGQLGVVGVEVLAAARRHVEQQMAGGLVLPDRAAVKARGGTQLGVGGARIQHAAVGVAVQVDDVARVGGRHQRDAACAHEIVQAVDVPVGVGHAQRLGLHQRAQFGRHPGAAVGDVDDQRRVAAGQGVERAHGRIGLKRAAALRPSA
ncbi:Uncharacterised protein [Bordetella pertussis]|nr:Uncharacterised protein [Bordetella pertussis]